MSVSQDYLRRCRPGLKLNCLLFTTSVITGSSTGLRSPARLINIYAAGIPHPMFGDDRKLWRSRPVKAGCNGLLCRHQHIYGVVSILTTRLENTLYEVQKKTGFRALPYRDNPETCSGGI
jgi:hypothetical protein